MKAYVPARFAVCPGYLPGDTGSLEPSSILAHLPGSAQALLRGNEQTYDVFGGVTGGNPRPPSTLVECFEVTEEARALDGFSAMRGSNESKNRITRHGPYSRSRPRPRFADHSSR